MGETWSRLLQRALAEPPSLLSLETLSLEARWARTFHATPVHELVHVLRGCARIEQRGRTFEVAPGDTFVIPRGTRHRDVFPDGDAYSALYLFFRWPGGDDLLRRSAVAGTGLLPAGATLHLHWLMKELEGDYFGERPGAEERMRLLLLEILLELYRCHGHSRTALPPDRGGREALARERRRRLVREVQEYLRAHYAEALELEALARRFGVSPFHLCRAFSQEMGATLTDMLTTLRIEAARDLLRDGRRPLKQVSEAVGFAAPGYFAKVFRRVTGLSPTQYRVRHWPGSAGRAAAD
jgi:AraC-like DNA-binding protein